MTATQPNSTPAPGIPPEWQELWQSALWLHPDAEPALRNAIAAGADPRQLRLVQLVGEDAPAFWFGPRAGECRIYNPAGFAGTAMVGRVG